MARMNVKMDQSYKLRHLKKLLGLKKQAQNVHTVICKLAGLAASSNDLNEFYQALHQLLKDLLNAPKLFIVFRNQISQQLEIPYYATAKNTHAKPKLPDSVIEMGLTGYLLRKKSSLLCTYEDYQSLVDDGEIIELGQPAESWLGVYVTRENGDPGVFAIASYQKDIFFDEQDKLILELLSEHIVHAIDRVTYHVQMSREIGSRAAAVRELQGKIAQQQGIKNQLLAINQLVFNWYEKFDVAEPSETLYLLLSELIHQQLCHSHYLTKLDKAKQTWSLINQLDPSGHLDFENTIRLNQYLTLEPQARILDKDELSDLDRVSLLPGALQQLKQPFVASSVLLNNNQESILLVIYGEQRKGLSVQDQLEILRYICFQIRLILNQVQAQISLQQMQDYWSEPRQTDPHDLKQQIEEHKRIQAQLYYDANHDLLTGLPNRQLFNRRLLQAVAAYSLNPDRCFSVLFIDLDKFKLINDSFGTRSGDSFLLEASRRLMEPLQQEDMLARLGGDEFVVLLNSCPQIEQAKRVAEQLINRLNEAYLIEGREIYASCSIGITGSEHKYKKPADVLRDADTAVYQAKKLGRGRYVVFNNQMHLQLVEQMTQESELRKTLKLGNLTFIVQPMIQLPSNSICAVEAMLRWQYPGKGLLQPRDWIHVAADSGLLQQLDILALQHALKTLSQGDFPADISLMSMNMSRYTLFDQQSRGQMIELLREHSAVVAKLTIDLCEKAFCCDTDACIDALAEIRKTGVRIALDNFSQNFGSLKLLFCGKFDVIKLAPELIRKAHKDAATFNLVKELVGMSQRLGLTLIAEGIIDSSDKRLAESLGCEYVRGSFLAWEPGNALSLKSANVDYLMRSRKFAI